MTPDTPPPAPTAADSAAAPRSVWPKAVPLLVLAGLLAYSNSFTKAFVFDDVVWITADADLAAGHVSHYAAARGRPVPALSLVLNHKLGGFNPTGYHAFNLAVHVLAGLTLYGLARRLLLSPRFAGRYDDAAPFLAFAVALLWLVHPLQTQAVTYVIQRDESLMALFYLFALYAWVRGAAGGSRAWSAAAVGSFALSGLCKEVAVTLPPVLLVLDRVFLARSWRDLGRRWPAYLGVLAVWVLMLRPAVAQAAGGAAHVGVGFGIQTATPLHYLFTQAEVIPHYLRLAVWPTGQAIDYLDWPIAKSFGEVWPRFLAVGALFAAGCVLLAVRPAAGFVVVWFFAILAPTSSIMPIVDPAFEHRMYLPLAAVLAALVLAGYSLVGRFGSPERAPGVVTRAALALAVPLLALTYARNETYRSPLATWEAAVAARPNNPRAWANVAAVHLSAGATGPAGEALKRAEACGGPHAVFMAYRQLPVFLTQVGRLEEAEAAYRNWTGFGVPRPEGQPEPAYNPHDHPIPYRNLSRVLIARGKPSEAAAAMRKLIGNQPLVAENHLILAAAELAAGRDAEARAAAAEAAKLDPNVGRAAAAAARAQVFAEEETPAWAGFVKPRAVWEVAAACLADGDRDPMTLDTLALWHARLARFDATPNWLAWPVRLGHLRRAADAARRGVAAAEARGDADWAEALRARLGSYEAGKPYGKGG